MRERMSATNQILHNITEIGKKKKPMLELNILKNVNEWKKTRTPVNIWYRKRIIELRRFALLVVVFNFDVLTVLEVFVFCRINGIQIIFTAVMNDYSSNDSILKLILFNPRRTIPKMKNKYDEFTSLHNCSNIRLSNARWFRNSCVNESIS